LLTQLLSLSIYCIFPTEQLFMVIKDNCEDSGDYNEFADSYPDITKEILRNSLLLWQSTKLMFWQM